MTQHSKTYSVVYDMDRREYLAVGGYTPERLSARCFALKSEAESEADSVGGNAVVRSFPSC